MTDLFKSKEHEFYIELKQERYYFPGEDISGDVILDLTKATKTNSIKVVLEGLVELGGRTMTLFSKSVFIAQSPDGEKSYYLEPHTHRFPFVITIPTSKECKVPSTLEIAKLLKVNYRLTAIYNKPLALFEKLSSSTTMSINILEDINVESAEYSGDYKVEKELCLTGETRPVKVSTIIGKRAAVKGDTIPITVTVEHIGVMVRDKAISVQLLRSVYYGKNKTELFGPKMLREVTANIEISGPVNFTKSFNMQLAIPPNLCPTVDKSGQSFRIEYTLRVSVNLNEENPHRPEVPQDVVLFNVPFTIGTYPKLSFNIDDDEDDEDEVIQNDQQRDEVESNHSSEYDQVAEKMKDLDLSLEAVPPQMIQQTPREEPPSPIPKTTNNYTPLPALSSSPKATYLTSSPKSPAYIPPPMMKQEPKPQVIKKDSLSKPDTPSAEPTETYYQIPMMIAKPIPPQIKNSSPVVTPLERLSPTSTTIPPFPTPKMEFATNLGGGSSSPTKPSPKQQPINSPKSPVSYYQPTTITSTSTVTTTPPPEQVIAPPQLPSPYNPKANISPSEVFNDYQPMVSLTTSMHRHDSVASMHPSTSTSTINTTATGSTLGRQESVHWIVRNQDAPAPAAAVVSPVITNNNTYPPALPPRPSTTTPSHSNNNSGFNSPMSQPQPTPSYSQQDNNSQYNNNYNHHYSPPQGHYPLSHSQQPYQQPFNNNNIGFGGMPVPQPAPQYNYNYNNNSQPPLPPQYNNYNNNYNRHPQQQNNVAFPVPHPHNYGGNMGMMGMPSHQNYQQQQQQPYPYYNN